MAKIQLAGGPRLHYQRVGSGPDVVMVHGITGNLAIWHLHIVPALAGRVTCHTYDLRGHGLSETPPTGYSADAMAEDLLGLLNALELERPMILGHSYGADIALYFAARHPERVQEVIAIEAALPALEELRRGQDWMGWRYWGNALAQAGHEVPAEHRTDLRYLIRATIDLPKQWGPLRGLPRNPRPLLRLLEETSLPEDYRQVGTLTAERLSVLQTPVTLMYAEQSAFLSTFDYLMEHLPDPRPVLLPQTEYGHFGPLEQPEAVIEELSAVLTRAESLTTGGD
jgi:pimeloyl-ACP methyl ester carboxylesterase